MQQIMVSHWIGGLCYMKTHILGVGKYQQHSSIIQLEHVTNRQN